MLEISSHFYFLIKFHSEIYYFQGIVNFCKKKVKLYFSNVGKSTPKTAKVVKQKRAKIPDKFIAFSLFNSKVLNIQVNKILKQI